MAATLAPPATVVLPSLLDGAGLDRLHRELITAVRRTTCPVVFLDAGSVECISSAGLAVLVAAAAAADERGIQLEVCRASTLFRESMALTAVGRHLLMA